MLCAVLLAQLILSRGQLSQTADEATHLYAGYRYLKCGDLSVSPEHPPLAKVVDSVPLLAMNVAVDCTPFKGNELQQAFAGVNWLYSQNWPVVLERARATACVFAIGLSLLVWIGARRMFGFATAVVATLLLVFEPNVLAYGPLVLTDVPVTCLMLLAVLGFYFWIQRWRTWYLLLTAVATGLTLLTKHSGLAVVPMLCVLAVGDGLLGPNEKRPKWQTAFGNLLAVALIVALAVAMIWVGYGLQFVPRSGGEAAGTRQQPAATNSATGGVLHALEAHHWLPQAYLRGFGSAVKISGQTSAAFVAGQFYSHAPWFSTPFNFLVRTSAAMLAMLLAGVAGVALSRGQKWRERLFLYVPMAIYLAICLHASSNVSVRYLLPMFPFLLIATADGCVELANRSRWAAPALAGFLLLHAASSLHAYPNYLSYANDLVGGPAQAYRYESWVDIGQSYPEARAYLETHPVDNCWLVTGWQWDPAIYGVPCKTSGLYMNQQIPRHVRGTVIVSSTLLTDVRLSEEELAVAFRKAMPKDHIGGSALLVFEGDFDTSLNASIAERNLAASDFVAGQAASAQEHAKAALELAPMSPIAHGSMCLFLAASSRAHLAIPECEIARGMLQRDPLKEEAGRKQYLESVDAAIKVLKNY